MLSRKQHWWNYHALPRFRCDWKTGHQRHGNQMKFLPLIIHYIFNLCIIHVFTHWSEQAVIGPFMLGMFTRHFTVNAQRRWTLPWPCSASMIRNSWPLRETSLKGGAKGSRFERVGFLIATNQPCPNLVAISMQNIYLKNAGTVASRNTFAEK